jgi:DnaJ-class molecular chaperone
MAIEDETMKCPYCNGAGRLMKRPIPFRKLSPTPCFTCKGTGQRQSGPQGRDEPSKPIKGGPELEQVPCLPQ